MAEACTAHWEALGTRMSASDKASPWQNGYQESFFSACTIEIDSS